MLLILSKSMIHLILGCCSKDGRYGLFSPPRGGLDVLDLKSGDVVRTLIPKVAEGIFHVIAQFNETDEYVLYYHSGKKTLKVFRLLDGAMIANYRVPSNLTSMESTSDGNNVALGMVDGNLSILTIADPRKGRMKKYLRSLPSRQGLQAVITTAPRLSRLVKTTAVVKDFTTNTRAQMEKNQAKAKEEDSGEEKEDVELEGEKEEEEEAKDTPSKKRVSIMVEENQES